MANISFNNYIFLYNGLGSSPICVEETAKKLGEYCQKYAVIKVDSTYITREKCIPSLIVLPGGSAMSMGSELKSAIPKIKCFVANGAGFFGICAGAMVASSKWDFLIKTVGNPWGDGISETNMLHRLNLGPYSFAPTFEEGNLLFDEPTPRLADIQLNSGTKDTFKTYWHSGPVFYGNLRENALVAEYESNSSINPLLPKKGDPLAAVIHTTYGLGHVVFSGIHPEMAEWSENKGYPISEEDTRLNNLLFQECCRRAGVHHSTL